jgi:hypothetical protein
MIAAVHALFAQLPPDEHAFVHVGSEQRLAYRSSKQPLQLIA